MKNIKTVKMVDLDNYVKAHFKTEEFVYFTNDGMVMATDQVGTYQKEGEVYLITFLGNEDEVFKVNSLEKEREVETEMKPATFSGKCQALTAKGKRCKNPAKYTMADGHVVCGNHKEATSFHDNKEETVKVNEAMDQGAIANPESTKEGVKKMREALVKEEEEKFQAFVMGQILSKEKQEDGKTEMLIECIYKSAETRTIEEQLAEVRKHFGHYDSMTYVFFRSEAGTRRYFKRGKELSFKEVNVFDNYSISTVAQDSCVRCLGTGVYAGPSGFTRTGRAGVPVAICFGCHGTGSAKKAKKEEQKEENVNESSKEQRHTRNGVTIGCYGSGRGTRQDWFVFVSDANDRRDGWRNYVTLSTRDDARNLANAAYKLTANISDPKAVYQAVLDMLANKKEEK